MKKLNYLLLLLAVIAFILYGCKKDDSGNTGYNGTGQTIAGYQIAKENVLRSVPVEYINAARNNLHVAYQHTSHGTHVSRGMFGLPDYKSGDDVLFGITNNDPQSGKLDFKDLVISDYAAAGDDASDLSRNETAFIQATRNYLDDADNADVNVIMWSWCSIVGHHPTENYLPGMQTLISEYGVGGSKIGTGSGKRANSVTFVFMTGHGEIDNVGDLKPKNQADTIIGFCKANDYYCLDYFGIDSHDMNENYWSDAGDNGNSDSYGGNFYEDWQSSHTLGTDYYENKNSPGGEVVYGEHNSQHITANRKAFAMWWILARIEGWNGE
jgi:hypothetical protein